MLLELVIVALPFIVGLVLLGLKHDLTDTEYLQELERERNANL